MEVRGELLKKKGTPKKNEQVLSSVFDTSAGLKETGKPKPRPKFLTIKLIHNF